VKRKKSGSKPELGEIMIRKLSMSLLAILALSLATTAGYAQSQAALTRHTRDVVLNGTAKMVGHLPATRSMRLVLTLPLRNQAELEDFLRDVNDPYSRTYRQFLTVEQFTERFGPTQADYDLLTRFAEANGLRVVNTSRNRLNLDVEGSVANVEKALNVTMWACTSTRPRIVPFSQSIVSRPRTQACSCGMFPASIIFRLPSAC
jgi:subtilase family serine protease